MNEAQQHFPLKDLPRVTEREGHPICVLPMFQVLRTLLP